MEAESRATDRLTLFSDAVVAIAITLLAIDLPVPEGGTVHLFWESVRHNSGHYAAFLISFFAIAAAWRDHHDIFKYVRRVDSRLRMLNTLWLLRAVDPALLRHRQRLDLVDRRPAGGVTVASSPPPQAEPRGRPGAG
jgi:hypothetical protein